jgi:hypothetical protein
MSDHPSLEVRTRLWPETLNSSLIAGTIAEEDYKGNDWVVDGMKIRDNLLGRQAVAFSPLARFTSALQPVLYDTRAM